MPSSVTRVSVLMPVFNSAAFLPRAIESVVSQTLEDLELIIVDDGSTDGSWSIISAAVARDRRVIASRRAVCGGAGAALNDALARARGRYIARQDADDESSPERLAEQVAFLEADTTVGAVGTAVVIVDTEGKPQGIQRFPEADQEIESTLLDRMCFCGPTVVARRSAIEKAGFRFDEALSGSEDYDFCLRLSEISRLANLSRPLYHYRQHEDSVSHLARYQQLRRKAVALQNALRRRFGERPPLAHSQLVARDYLRAAVLALASDDEQGARECARLAVAIAPEFLDDGMLIKSILERYGRSWPVHRALHVTQSLVDNILPRGARLELVKRQLVAHFHISAAVAARPETEGVIRAHIWPAVRSNPACLVNWEVLSLVLKRALRPEL